MFKRQATRREAKLSTVMPAKAGTQTNGAGTEHTQTKKTGLDPSRRWGDSIKPRYLKL